MARGTRAADAEEEDDLAEDRAALEAAEEAAAEEVSTASSIGLSGCFWKVAVGARIVAAVAEVAVGARLVAAVAEDANVAEGGEEEEVAEEAAVAVAGDDTPPAGVLFSAKSATKCLAKRRHMSPW